MDGKSLGDSPVNAMATVDGYSQLGITLREHFAGLAMAELAEKHRGQFNDMEWKHDDHFKWVAQGAVRYADALLAELAKRAGGES